METTTDTQDFLPDEGAPGFETLTLKLPVRVDSFGRATPEQVEATAREAATAVRNACRRRGWGVAQST